MRFLLFCIILSLSHSKSLCLYDENGGRSPAATRHLGQITIDVLAPKNLTNTVVLESDNAQSCLTGWIQRNNYCYKLFNNELKTFDEAEAFCRSYDGHLASITTSDEHDFLLDYILRDTRTDDLKYVWVGGKRFKLRYIWMDLELFSYVRWHPAHDSYSDTAQPSYNCVQFVTTAVHYNSDINFGKLINHPCTGKDNFICKLKAKN